MCPSSSDPTELIRALLRDAKDTYARLLTLIEHSLHTEPSQPGQPDATQLHQPNAAESKNSPEVPYLRQIKPLMEEADIRLRNLTEAIQPWPAKRDLLPPDLAEEVEQFFKLLGEGFSGLKQMLDLRVKELQAQRTELAESLGKLNQQRKGFQGYKQTSGKKGGLRREI